MPTKYLAQSLVCSKHSTVWPCRHHADGDDGGGGRRMTRTVLLDSMRHCEALPRMRLGSSLSISSLCLPFPRLRYSGSAEGPWAAEVPPGPAPGDLTRPVDLSLDEDLRSLGRGGSSTCGGTSRRFPGEGGGGRAWPESRRRSREGLEEESRISSSI